MLKDYGRILEDDPQWAARAAAFSTKVRDISEFLASIPLEKPPGAFQPGSPIMIRVTCAAAQGVWKQPRQLLGMIDGLKFVELPEADWCCGSAGSQLITHYETSRAVLERKMNNLAGTSAEVIASGCPGCQMQITRRPQRGLKVQVVHPVELLDQAMEVETYEHGTSPVCVDPPRLIDELERQIGRANVLHTP